MSYPDSEVCPCLSLLEFGQSGNENKLREPMLFFQARREAWTRTVPHPVRGGGINHLPVYLLETTTIFICS